MTLGAWLRRGPAEVIAQMTSCSSTVRVTPCTTYSTDAVAGRSTCEGRAGPSYKPQARLVSDASAASLNSEARRRRSYIFPKGPPAQYASDFDHPLRIGTTCS